MCCQPAAAPQFRPVPRTLDPIGPRPDLRFGAYQPDEPADWPADAGIDLGPCTSVVGQLDGSRNRAESAHVDETELGQIHADAQAAQREFRDALFELADRRDVQFAVEGQPHAAIRFTLLPDAKFLKLGRCHPSRLTSQPTGSKNGG